MKKVKAWFFGILVTLALFFGVYALILTFFTYADGARVGTLAKFSKKGFVFKTYEGELQQGFLESNPDTGVATRSWMFSVENEPMLITEIETALVHAGQVKLYYKEKLRVLPWVGDSRYLVYKIEPVVTSKPQ